MASKPRAPRKKKAAVETPAGPPAPAHQNPWQGGRYGDRIAGEPFERGSVMVGFEPWDFGHGTLYFGPGIEHLRERWAQWQADLGRIEFGNGKPGCGVWLTRGALGLSVDLDEEMPDPDELWARKPDFSGDNVSSRPTWQWDVPVALPVIDYVYSSRSGERVPVLLPSREAVWEQRYAKVAGDRDECEHRRDGGQQRKEIESRYELVEREWLSHRAMQRFNAVEAALEEHPDWTEDSPEMDPVYEAHPIPDCMNPKGTPRREAAARFREAVKLWRDRAVKQTGKLEFAVLVVPRRGAARWQRDREMWNQWAVRSPWYGEQWVGGVPIPVRRWYFLWDSDRVWDARWQAWSQVLGLLIDGFAG